MKQVFTTTEAKASRGQVATKAVLGAAERLGLTAGQLSGVIGLSPPTVSRMKKGGYVLDEGSKEFELALHLVRVFRSLDAITGGDEVVARHWMKNRNKALEATPLDAIMSVAGLLNVSNYLDSRRAII